jgi:hypothetical protein
MVVLAVADNELNYFTNFWSFLLVSSMYDACSNIQWGTKLFQCFKDLDCTANNSSRKNDKIPKILM